MIHIPCVLFAGGRSSRMGKDKALLPFGDATTLTEFQYKRLRKIFSSVYISCKDKKKFNFTAEFILDTTKDKTFAPTLGFISALTYLNQSFFAISVDSPFIDATIIEKIVTTDRETDDATIAKTEEGIQPLCGIYHLSLLPSFHDMLTKEQHKLGFLLKNSKTQFVNFQDKEKFLNLNHPHEYKKALQIINSSSL